MIRLSPLALAALVGLIVLDGGFVYDDPSLLVENPVVNGGVPWWEAFVRDFWGRDSGHGFITWRPVMPVVWAWLWVLFPGEPLAFRVLGVLLHVFAVAMGVRFLRRLSFSSEEAAAAGALFALHPLNTEAVSAIAAQADVLSFALVLIACTTALDALTWKNATACAGVFLIAALVKESAIVYAPLAALLFAARPASTREKFLAVAPLAAVTLAVVAFQLALPRAPGVSMITSNLAHSAEGAMRLLLGLHNAGRALVMTVWPHPIAPNHGYAAVELQTGSLLVWASVGGVLLALGCAALLWAVPRRRLAWIAALCFLYAPAVLQTHWLVRLVTDLAERLLYPSAFGVSILFAMLLFRLAPRRKPRIALLATVAVAFVVVGFRPRRAWTDEDALWTYAVRVEPRAAIHHHNVSNTYFRSYDLDRGAYHRLLYTYLIERFPEPVPWALIERNLALPPVERFIELPRALLPRDPCPLVRSFVGTAAQYPPLRDYVAERWGAEYPRCMPSQAR